MARVTVRRNYRFIDKNPVIDVMRTAVQDEGLMERLQVVADLAGLTIGTIRGWFDGDVRDPRHSSVMTTLIGLGYENKWAKARKLDVEKELEFARAWLKRERAKAVRAAPKKRRKKRAA